MSGKLFWGKFKYIHLYHLSPFSCSSIINVLFTFANLATVLYINLWREEQVELYICKTVFWGSTGLLHGHIKMEIKAKYEKW